MKTLNLSWKKFVLTFLALILLTTFSFSQSRSIRGEKFFQAGIGFRGAGPLVSAYTGMTFNPTIKGALGGGIGNGKSADIKYTYFFVDATGSFTLNNLRKVFFLNGQAGISFNGDLINDFKTENYDKQFSLNYGVFAGLEGEFYVTRTLLFVLAANQRYYIKKDFGNWRYQIVASARFTF